ncbi:MAG: DUF4837 family protein [Marinifilaceae bacterium]
MKKYIIVSIVLLITFTSCKDSSTFKPQCTGKAYEMLCIMKKTQWESAMGDSIKACLASNMLVLPQNEPDFKIFSVSLNNFGSQLKTHRNIFEIRIDKKQKKSTIYIKRGYMAKQQTFVRVVCSSEKEFFTFYERNKYKLKKIFLDAELSRNKQYFTKYTDTKIFNKLKARYNYSLRVPAGYNMNKDTLGFVWISQETGKNSRGVFIYSYDYVSQDQFKQENIIAKRDEMLKRFVPGSLPKSYMTTARSMDFVSRKIEQDSCYTIETRGLWELKGDFMGGPFVNLTILNQKTNKIVCIDGYVYAPSEHKRLMTRQVEAVIKSIKFIESEKVK